MAATTHRYRRDLTLQEKNQVVQWLLQNHMKNGQLERGAPKKAGSKFTISLNSVRRIWTIAKVQLEKGEVVQFQSKRRDMTHVDKMQPDIEKIKSLTCLQRGTIRKMAANLGISKSLLGNWIHSKQLKAHTSAVKPQLTDANKVGRLKFSLSQLMPEGINDETLTFNSMHNVVRIDKKWFFMSKTSDRYYLLPEEADPYRCCKSKRFIMKVMFMCAVSRPHIQASGQVEFDGKIGIFPFTEVLPALRNSKNRAKGTMETKPIHSVTKSVIKDCIINQVIPAIKQKWPKGASRQIIIQQDNAKPHLQSNDPDFLVAGNSDGFKITLMSQPPNSPDTPISQSRWSHSTKQPRVASLSSWLVTLTPSTELLRGRTSSAFERGVSGTLSDRSLNPSENKQIGGRTPISQSRWSHSTEQLRVASLSPRLVTLTPSTELLGGRTSSAFERGVSGTLSDGSLASHE